MPTPKERLSHLLELASQGPQQRAALAGEVADLLLDWPQQYPSAMHATFEALLEKIAREMDPAALGELAARFEGRAGFMPSLLNEFFFGASPVMKDAILACNDSAARAGDSGFADTDADRILAAARSRDDFAGALAHLIGVPQAIASAIVADRSGRALAAACKGARLNRATFSAIVILAGPVRAVQENFALLAIYDRVPANGAAHLLAFWRSKSENVLSEAAA